MSDDPNRARVRRGVAVAAACAVACLAACDQESSMSDDARAAGTPAATADGTGSGAMTETEAFAAVTDAWHAERLEQLTDPDGWLTLVALAWLDPGENTIGRAARNTVSYDGLAADVVGTITVGEAADADDASVPIAVGFEVADGVSVSGVPSDGRLLTDAHPDGPTTVTLGSVSWFVVERGGRLAVRMKDAESPTRTAFAGIERFDADPAWRIVADFEPVAESSTVPVESVIGTVDDTAVAGRARFEYEGHAVDLVMHPASDGAFFVVFGDTTNGSETYGGGRFLRAEPTIDGGAVILDFNRAYNPPCSFTPYATCPLPVASNRMPFAVTAGERWTPAASAGQG